MHDQQAERGFFQHVCKLTSKPPTVVHAVWPEAQCALLLNHELTLPRLSLGLWLVVPSLLVFIRAAWLGASPSLSAQRYVSLSQLLLSQLLATVQPEPLGMPDSGGVLHTPSLELPKGSEQLCERHPSFPVMHFAPAPPHIPSVPQKK